MICINVNTAKRVNMEIIISKYINLVYTTFTTGM